MNCQNVSTTNSASTYREIRNWFPLYSILVCFFALLLSSCSSNPTPEQQALTNIKWNYEPDAIILNLNADKNLNEYDNQPHTLMLVVTQFDQPNTFETFSSNGQQLSNLLLMNTAPSGLIGLTRVFIEPGQSKQVRLARLEGTKLVGISAGYAHLDPLRSVRMYRIGVENTSTGWFSKTWFAHPKPLEIELLLGPDSLLRSKQSQPKPVLPTKPVEGEVPIPGTS